MYAVIKTGGKQYRIQVGEKLKVEQLDVENGSALVIDQRCLARDAMTKSASSKCVAVNTTRNTKVTGRITLKYKLPVFRLKELIDGT